MKKHKIPAEFCFQDIYPYPITNLVDFEYYLALNVNEEDIKGDRIFLPFTLTAYFKLHNYGQSAPAIKKLQSFIDSLDRSKKYFVYCQYDDGTLIDWKGLDVMIFGSGGGRIDYVVPLLCQPSGYDFAGIKKDILCSFVGRETHPIRREVMKVMSSTKDCLLSNAGLGMYEYCKILARSKYVLCSRGYGATSFRLCEALQYGCVPVYVSDDFLIPHGKHIGFCYGVQVSAENISDLPRLINERLYSENDVSFSIETYENWFTFKSNKEIILTEAHLDRNNYGQME